MVYKRFRTKRQLFEDVQCVTFKEQLNQLEKGVDVLDDRRNNEYQIKSPEDYTEEALKAPMGLMFVSRLEAGQDFHNPVFSDVAGRLGLDKNFNPVQTSTED